MHPRGFSKKKSPGPKLGKMGPKLPKSGVFGHFLDCSSATRRERSRLPYLHRHSSLVANGVVCTHLTFQKHFPKTQQAAKGAMRPPIIGAKNSSPHLHSKNYLPSTSFFSVICEFFYLIGIFHKKCPSVLSWNLKKTLRIGPFWPIPHHGFVVSKKIPVFYVPFPSYNAKTRLASLVPKSAIFSVPFGCKLFWKKMEEKGARSFFF